MAKFNVNTMTRTQGPVKATKIRKPVVEGAPVGSKPKIPRGKGRSAEIRAHIPPLWQKYALEHGRYNEALTNYLDCHPNKTQQEARDFLAAYRRENGYLRPYLGEITINHGYCSGIVDVLLQQTYEAAGRQYDELGFLIKQRPPQAAKPINIPGTQYRSN